MSGRKYHILPRIVNVKKIEVLLGEATRRSSKTRAVWLKLTGS